MRKIVVFTILSFSLAGCIPSTVIPDIKNIEPSKSPSTIISSIPTATATAPIVEVSPTAQPVETSLPTSTPTPVETSTPIVEQTKTPLYIGLNKVYDSITSGTSELPDNDIQKAEDDLYSINPSFVVIDLNQKIVDPSYQGKNYFSWKYYDKIYNYLKDRKIDIYFTIKFDKFIDNKSSPKDSIQEEFIIEAVKKYIQYDNNIYWVIGEKINDPNSTVGTPKDYITYLSRISKIIKKEDSKAKVYAGSISQGEIFGKDYIETNENLLSYINLGIGDLVDGFLFENYFLSVSTYYNADSNLPFSGLNYMSSKQYYESIKELLLKKGLKNKELILRTGTFGGDILEKIKQTEVEQGNENFKAIIYAKTLGFDKLFLDRFYDYDSTNAQDFFSRTGLIKVYNKDAHTKKTSYWSFKFMTDKLNGVTFKEKIEGLPSNIEGYIFKKENKNYYIVWNNDKEFSGSVSIPVKEKSGVIYYSADQISTLGSSIEFQTPTSGKYTINFAIDNLNPKILETVD